ncbi:hypothetical protein QBC45DRAFT_176582 [Copromyces sp. CBS 386.78]|nr:hypothetical protein QBC45DRAFT_176582 [Copromyces sp. CBS 386.78]
MVWLLCLQMLLGNMKQRRCIAADPSIISRVNGKEERAISFPFRMISGSQKHRIHEVSGLAQLIHHQETMASLLHTRDAFHYPSMRCCLISRRILCHST